MGRNIILVKSESGSTMQYAEWIKDEEPSIKICCFDDFDFSTIKNYYKVIIGSSVYKGDIVASNDLNQNLKHLMNSNIYLFTVGIKSGSSKDSSKDLDSLDKDFLKHLKGHTKLQGTINHTKLSLSDKIYTRLKGLRRFDKKELDKRGIEPIVSYLKGTEWKYQHNLRHSGNQG